MMTMTLLADVLLGAGALGAMVYCAVLARKLATFSDLEKGMGGAIAVLSVQVDDMTKALAKAQVNSGSARADLEALVTRAEQASTRLELLLSSLHDLPQSPAAHQSPKADDQPRRVQAGPSNVTTPSAVQWRRHRSAGGA